MTLNWYIEMPLINMDQLSMYAVLSLSTWCIPFQNLHPSLARKRTHYSVSLTFQSVSLRKKCLLKVAINPLLQDPLDSCMALMKMQIHLLVARKWHQVLLRFVVKAWVPVNTSSTWSERPEERTFPITIAKTDLQVSAPLALAPSKRREVAAKRTVKVAS